MSQSTYIQQFLDVSKEIEEAMEEAKSNIEFLQILVDPCEEVGGLQTAMEIPPAIPQLLQLFRVIWLNAPYYNTKEKLTNLCRTISNLVILQCTKTVDLELIFEGHTRAGIKLCEDCIDCCLKYKYIYSKVAGAHSSQSDVEWDLDIEIIFNHVDSFIQRCNDMIEICESMIIFARKDETDQIDQPRFRGARGEEFEKAIDKVEDQFMAYLDDIYKVKDTILNIHASTWYKKILNYRKQMKELDVMMQNLSEAVFSQVSNVEEGLYAVQAFYHYAKRDAIRAEFNKMTTEVYKLFADEVQTVKEDIMTVKKINPTGLLKFSGKAMLLHLKRRRLERLIRMLDDARWLPACGMGEEARLQYQKVMRTINDTIKEYNWTWQDTLDEDMDVRLDRSLLCHSSSKAGYMECNFDRYVMVACEEAKLWERLKFEVPVQLHNLHSQWKTLKLLYCKVVDITKDYNHILDSLSPEERVLFREVIRACDKKTAPGFNKLMWSSEMLDQYINDCSDYISGIQEFIEDFKSANREIVLMCEKICDTPMISVASGHVYLLSELDDCLENFKDDVLSDLQKVYEKIMMYMLVVHEGFAEHIEAMGVHWHRYVHRMDGILEEALIQCVNTSLQVMREILHGEDISGPTPFIRICVTLKGTQVAFEPHIYEVGAVIEYTLQRMVEAIEHFPRLFKKFNVPCMGKEGFSNAVETDPGCLAIQQEINTEFHTQVQHIQVYLQTWKPFKEMWELDKDMFVKRFEKLNPTVASFDSNIARYTEVANNVHMIESIADVYFLIVDAAQLKQAITDHCNTWQNKLTDLMYRVTYQKIKDCYEYTSENGEKLRHVPQSLPELQEAIKHHDAMVKQIKPREKEFPVIKELFSVLQKYEYACEAQMLSMLEEMDQDWLNFLRLIDDVETRLTRDKERFRTGLLIQREVFKTEASNLLTKFIDEGPFSSDWSTADALSNLRAIRTKLTELRGQEAILKENLAIFGISIPENLDLQKLDEELSSLELVWQLTDEWDRAWATYKTGGFWAIETQEMEDTAQTLFRKLTRLSRELKDKNWSIVEVTRSRVDAFRRTLPLIGDLKNTAMRDRHWERVKVAINRSFDQHSPDFTLDAIMSMNMQKYAEEISDISKAATMELAIENGLKAIAETWKNMTLEMLPLKGGIYKIKIADELTQALEENQVAIGIMKSTKFVEPFIKEVDYWEKGLTATTEVLDLALVVQRQFLYLENIFHGEDIRKQMPEETTIFEDLTNKWRSITSKMNKDKNAFRATHVPNIWKDLNKLNDTLEAIQRALESYLETKRHIFPRFYFISNDDLLEVLAQSRRPQLVQPHLKKCFDNINKLNMQKNPGSTRTEALGMYSLDGEYIDFVGMVLLEGPVELWLCEIETIMRVTLKEQLKATLTSLKMNLTRRDNWIKDWPGQMCITSSQIQWTTQCTRALIRCKIMEIRKPLKKLKKKEQQVLEKYSEAVRGSLTKIQRLKVVSLVTIEIHARDVVENMYKQGVMDVMSFSWLSQLRFYWDKQKDDCVVKQTNTIFNYSYEYLGNSGRLVITPLTDRCYITLTMALNLHRGGSPKGPAGTGKTETVKDLGKALGSYVIVVNCSEGLDYKSMGRMFSGLSQTGAWGCFDEFNRINIEVLSVVAQQILCVLSALAANLERFVFDDVEINLKPTCGIFITMNPGYAGRTELPDNLKSMFRPISMIVPDSCLIAEIILFGEGFHNTRVLAKKVFTLYSLATQQLSKQDHYDFGLRALVSVLRYAGRIRREHSDLPDEKVALLAMRDMNIAKLTADDLPLFTGIIGDLFPGVTVPEIQYEILGGAIRNYFDKAGLECTPAAYLKVIQLYETKNSRHSVMIVGVTGSGKSATWKALQGASSQLAKSKVEGWNIVKEFPMNPKAVTLAELYGEFNLTTNEWLDGVLSSIMRNTCSDESPDLKWIIFDGPVDAVWIENMNSVMDDNKILTLINSERITMPDQVSLLFEVADLAVASPATVSRCGMVYNDYKDLGWKPYVNCWLKKQEDKGPAFVEQVGELFRRHVDAVLQFKLDNCHELITIPELNSVMSLCKLFDCLGTRENGLEPEDEEHFEGMVKMWFLFCLVWSICAAVDEEGRKKIDTFIREREGIYPLKETVYEYYVDTKSKAFMLWEGRLLDSWRYNKDDPFYKIIVPTVDTMRYEFLIGKLMENNYPGLLIGPVGTGKTSTAQTVLESLNEAKYSVLEIHMSAQTSSRNVQDAIEGRVEKRSKGIFGPPGGKTMISFMEDLNMPAKETFGAQPPLELVRQWIDYGFWYNREKQTRTYIKNMLVMGAMGPPGGGRTQISDRLLSRFNIINLTFPSEATITRIFATLLNIHLSDFHDEIKVVGRSLTAATIQLYFAVIANMLPTPTKMHYLFNLRDISKVFQGILRSHPDYQTTATGMLRLWMHECYRVFNDRLIDDKDEEWFLNQMDATLGKFYDVTFRSLWPTNTVLIFGDFVNPYGMYEDLDDVAKLRKYLEEQMQEYNDSPGVVTMSLVLFTDAIQHITRIVRVASQPRGNMLLIGIGGSGRQSLSRIASYICEYQVFQIEVKKNYGVPEFKEDLKILYKLTGLELRPTAFVFSDVQVTTEAFLEIINNILSSGEVANLYKPEEFEEIRNALMKDMSKAGITPSNENVQHFLIERVRSNLHVILCLSPIGDAFRDRIRQYPSFVNCTTIDWFKDWPKDALLEVAARYISDMDFMMTILPVKEEEQLRERDMAEKQASLRASVAFMFATIHDSVAKYSKRMINEMRRYNYVTPTNYLELVKGYKDMLEEKRTHLFDAANKLRNGLDKIEDTKIKVQDMSVELAEAQIQVNQFQQECDKYLVNIVNQRMEADEQKAAVAAQSVTIKEEEVVCKKLADVALKDLEQAMPALEAAMKALDALNKKDLAEVKSYGRPPPKVELVMEAVMIFKQADPTWAEAKRQLGDPNFLNNLKDFDRDHIPERVLRKIGTYTGNPEFDPEKVGTVSFAAKSLSMWVIAMEKYGIIYRIIAPKKEKLDVALATLKEKQDSLAAAQAQLRALSEYLEQLQKEYEEKLKMKEELKRKAELLALKLERAGQLVDGLSGERERWTQSVFDMNEEYWRLPGDCLIATGFVAYVGPFVSMYREELVTMWKSGVVEQEVPCSEDFIVSNFLSDPTTIREWNIQGLPSDSFSTENGIIVTRATRWPLLIDPQCQGMKWLKKFGRKMKLTVIDFGMLDYMKIMETAIQFGKAILLQNVSEVLDPSLNPILNKAIIKQGGQTLIKLTDKMVSYNEKFRLFITTKMSNPHYAPEITTKTTLVNFSVKEQGLEAQLLGIVVRKEKPQLEEQKSKLVLDIAASKRKLLNLEDELLRLLYETKGSLLDDLDLLITLQTSKETSVSVSVKLEVAEKTEKDIDNAREGYRPSAKRASILFFVLNDMSQIDPMYQFSLDAYIILFTLSIDKSPKESELAERIISLNNYHTYAVYRYSCRGLFENHKLLFSFHMCIKILTAIGKINEAEYQFLLKGGVVLDKDTQLDNPCPEWLSEEAWDNITELDRIPGFHGLADTFEQFAQEWHMWYINTNPEALPLLGDWNKICTEFQKMLFVRCLRSDRLSFSVTNFIVNNLGPQFVEPPVLDIKAVLEDSTPQTPLIFVLSPGVDPTGSLAQLAEAREMTKYYHSLSLGQGQAPVATRLIEAGAKEGHWVFLANCHLSLSWMPKLDKIVDNLQSSPVHKRFRLWLSSSPNPEFPISILQAGIKMTTEPPRGLKANLKRLYQGMTDTQFEACKNASAYKKLLFCLCFFHAVLIERRKFQQLGWNVVYSFNDSDFEISEQVLSNYLDEYEDSVPWAALKYLLASINYGGHVTDDWDRRLIETYVNQYFCEDALTTPNYRLSSLPTYYVPKDGVLLTYLDQIQILPTIDQAEAFGQHSNADITSLITETRVLCETLMSLQMMSSAGEGMSMEDKVLQLAAEVASRVPPPIDYAHTVKLIGEQRTPLDVVLLQEISRYNQLLTSMGSSLEELQKAIKGFVVMSSELEEIFTCMFDGRVPSAWLKAYSSLKLLGSWTRDLVLRVQHFSKWAETTHAPLYFWLSAFTFPTGFLTAVLQTEARRQGVSVDTLSWDFTVFTMEKPTLMVAPTEGVYVRGMFLEGAAWDRKNACLIEPEPMQLVVSMPVIHFKPMEVLKKRMKGIYVCPCYYFPVRCGSQGRAAYIVAIDLKSGAESHEFWVKRGTAILLSLAN